jgi:hypothetical protein
MPASKIDTDELVTPAWRDGSAYARTQGDETVANQVIEILSSQRCTDGGVTKEAAEKEIKTFYPQLTEALRITDLHDWKYWVVMLAICMIFLFVELAVIVGSDIDSGMCQ